MKRNTILDILAISKGSQKIPARKVKMLTSYTANVARFTQNIADMLLVGDSLAMVLYDMPSTHGVTLETMIRHAKAVVCATQTPLVVVDMPFGSYEISPQQAFENASKVIAESGGGSVKIEGGVEMFETIKFLVERGIPVVAHIGLMPQKIHTIGSYKKIDLTQKIIEDFESVANAGAFAVVLENVSSEISQIIAEKFPDVLTIGIGSGTNCKGHVAVFEDLINLSTETTPPFSKPIFDIKTQTIELIEGYFAKL